ncbi:potassium channel family protein [Histidinibacterium lentulum]|uniref:Trk system potassium uptake protein TrkA n=1 Tax=Histidinibacterium lentulum TaxID=2480588 RepID=A0A3N2R8L3_9RHOB|nr:TrkA family potassium uptake protein [Histidinibacterium lentulum]ROU03767.1 TrkA family potassium uptake protein [Histidinibacterium lentulum]
MRIVIIGASRFGIATAEQLIENGHEVVLIDKDATKLEHLAEELDCGFIEGDGSLPSVQRDAFGDHADALVALTNQDDENILAALVGKSVGFGRVVPQIVRQELLAVCEELELENLITPHATVARSIVRSLEEKSEASLDLRTHRAFEVLFYKVGAPCAGNTIRDLDLPRDVRVIALSRGEEERLVENDTRLEEGDGLIVAVAPEAQERMDEIMSKERGEEETRQDGEED